MSGLPPLPSNSVLETGLKKVFDEFKVLLTFFPRLIFSPSSCLCVASGTGCRGSWRGLHRGRDEQIIELVS